MVKQKIIIILGQTGSGKSDLALVLAKKYHGYLIGADSQQIYKGTNIGSNKDQGSWQNGKFIVDGVEEYLVDFLEPGQAYSVVDWVSDVKKIISANPNKLPIIVGGTGLYISALVDDYNFPGKKDNKLREKTQRLYEKKGIDYLINKLEKIDPEISQKIDITNPRRVIRAYEICQTSKKPLQPEKRQSNFEFLQIGIKVDRQKLYDRLEKRAMAQIETGLIPETEHLLSQVKDKSDPLLLGVGNRNVVKYLNQEITQQELVELNARDNRRYAKRQMTWFKRDKNIHWVEDFVEAGKLVDNFLA